MGSVALWKVWCNCGASRGMQRPNWVPYRIAGVPLKLCNIAECYIYLVAHKAPHLQDWLTVGGVRMSCINSLPSQQLCAAPRSTISINSDFCRGRITINVARPMQKLDWPCSAFKRDMSYYAEYCAHVNLVTVTLLQHKLVNITSVRLGKLLEPLIFFIALSVVTYLSLHFLLLNGPDSRPFQIKM